MTFHKTERISVMSEAQVQRQYIIGPAQLPFSQSLIGSWGPVQVLNRTIRADVMIKELTFEEKVEFS